MSVPIFMMLVALFLLALSAICRDGAQERNEAVFGFAALVVAIAALVVAVVP